MSSREKKKSDAELWHADYVKRTDNNVRECIIEIFKSGDDISIPLIQKRCRSGYYPSNRVFKAMVEEGLIVNKEGSNLHIFK